MNSNIQVIIRPRALNEKEMEENSDVCVQFYEHDSQKLTFKQDTSKEFIYDCIMTP